jgi:hypothetical protein
VSDFAQMMDARPLRYRQDTAVHNGYTLCFIRCFDDALGDTARCTHEVRQWCEQQFGPRTDHWKDRGIKRWGEIAGLMIFVQREDAMRFKLQWC